MYMYGFLLYFCISICCIDFLNCIWVYIRVYIYIIMLCLWCVCVWIVRVVVCNIYRLFS